MEFPLATLEVPGARLPGAGGAYLRHLPFSLVRSTMQQHVRRRRPAVFYIHPWEVDVDQPRLPVGRVTALRHYGGLARTLPRIERLLEEFTFRAICPPRAPLVDVLDATTTARSFADREIRVPVAPLAPAIPAIPAGAAYRGADRATAVAP